MRLREKININKEITKKVWFKVADVNRESNVAFSYTNNLVWRPVHRTIMGEVWVNLSDELLDL